MKKINRDFLYNLDYLTQILMAGGVAGFCGGFIAYYLKLTPTYQLLVASISGFLGSYIYDKLWREAII